MSDELAKRVEMLEKRVADLERALRPKLIPKIIGKRIGVAHILSGASMRAKSKGIVHTHEQLCKVLPEGIDVLAYCIGLMGAVAVDDPKRHVGRVASVIGIASNSWLERHPTEAL